MDHLPYPKEPLLPPIEILDISRDVESYDGFGFQDFPARVGWTKKHQGDQIVHWYDCEAGLAASRAQSWLYFGVLQEFLGEKFDRQAFLRYDPETCRTLLSTERLPALARAWSLERSVFASQSFFVSSTRYTIYMRLLLRLLNHYSSTRVMRNLLDKVEPPLDSRVLDCVVEAEDQSQSLDSKLPNNPEVTLSIKALTWSLRNAMINCLPKLSRDRADPSLSQSNLLRSRMLLGGNCPYWTDIYLKRYSIAMTNYIAAIPKYKQAKGHEVCDSKHCNANNVDERFYRTRHTRDNCQCSSAGADTEKIVSLIVDGKTPMIQITEPSLGNAQLEVRESAFELPYTAISHVWSGGLGNPRLNELPQCQLSMIKAQLLLCQEKSISGKSIWNEGVHIARWWAKFRSRYARVVGSRVHSWLPYRSTDAKPKIPLIFWMDTLCIPVGSKHKPVRRKAIGKMDFIYSGADNVLVLDPEVQNIMKSGMSVLEKRVHMLTSSWMTRCWTYQEARLSRDLMFALSGELYEPVLDYRRDSDIERSVKLHRVLWNDERELELEAISFVERLWPITDKRLDFIAEDEMLDFIRVWQELSQRATTRTEDLHAIFAILLGLDPKEILSLDHSDRMKAILRTQPSLPMSLLFLPHLGSNADNYKNRWMPQYPSGRISPEYGRIIRDESSGLFSLSNCGNLDAYIVQQGLSHHDIYISDSSVVPACVFKVRPMRDEYPEDHESPPNKTICYIFADHAATPSLGSVPEKIGARFVVSRVSHGKEYQLIYDCSVLYTVAIGPRERGSPLTNSTETSPLDSQKVDSHATFLLDCGTLIGSHHNSYVSLS